MRDADRKERRMVEVSIIFFWVFWVFFVFWLDN